MAWRTQLKSVVPLDSIREEEKIAKAKEAELKIKLPEPKPIPEYLNNPPKTYREKWIDTEEAKQMFVEKFDQGEDSYLMIRSCRVSLHAPPQEPWKKILISTYLKSIPLPFLYVKLSPYWHDYTTSEYIIWRANDLWYCLWLDYTSCPSGGCDGQNQELLIGVSPHDMVDQLPYRMFNKTVPPFLLGLLLEKFKQ
jgi:hypothetical protein